MKANKLKLLPLSICCLVAALFSEAQCADNVQEQGRNDETVKNYQTAICPTGSVIAYTGEVPNDGRLMYNGGEWLLCNGEAYDNQKYSELYKVVQMKYVSGSKHESWIIEANKRDEIKKFFCIPDIRGRVIAGVDKDGARVTSNNTLGAFGGEERHQLTVNELANHSHGLSLINASIASGSINSGVVISVSGNEVSRNTGGDQTHNNMQPYLILNYIINTGKMNNRSDNEIDQLKKKISDLEVSKQRYATMFDDLVVQVQQGLNSGSIMPIGAIMEYSGTVGVPANWLECNGAAVSRANYATLFANIGVIYGSGDNINTFNLPDRRGRVAVGIDSNNNTGGHVTNATAHVISLGGTFGEETHQLTPPELASHNHLLWNGTINADTQVSVMSGVHRYASGANLPTENAGGDQPHNNMQPSIFMRFFIRAK